MTETEIRIRLPLPLSVAAALTAAVGAMWPTATTRPDPSHLVFAIPDRAPKRTSRKQLRTILAETCDPDGDPDAFLERWTTTGPTIGVDTKTEAMQSLATWALIMLRAEAAPNYVEQVVRAVEPDGTERAFVVTAAWSKGQTPHERIKALEAEIANLHAAAMQRPADPTEGTDE